MRKHCLKCYIVECAFLILLNKLYGLSTSLLPRPLLPSSYSGSLYAFYVIFSQYHRYWVLEGQPMSPPTTVFLVRAKLLTLVSQVPSAQPAMTGIQRKVKKLSII